jgi:hypothetical protein
MNSHEWIERSRLQHQWPRLPPQQLREVAEELRREVERQSDPEHAAAQWLRQGMPTA